MADAINFYGAEIGLKADDLYMINPHQPNDEKASIKGSYRSVQYSRPSDLLSSGYKVGGLILAAKIVQVLSVTVNLV